MNEERLFLHLVVLGYGQFHHTTEQCLYSLIPELHRKDTQITVIDNGSTDDAALQQSEFVKAYPQIHSLQLANNLGFAGGMNEGAKQFAAEWLILVGSDTVFAPQAFTRLYDEITHLPKTVGIVGPVTNEAGTAQQLYFTHQNRDRIFQDWEDKMQKTGLITPIHRADFFCVAIRKSLWDQLGGLDLSYGRGYYEDVDFCMRASQLGYQCVMLEDVFVYHAGSQSFKSDPEQKALIRQNKKIFENKFPKAQLLHRREDNLKVIEYYLQSLIQPPPGALQRIHDRLLKTREELPRSFWKRWQWQRRVKKLERQIHQLGVQSFDNTTQI
jgi:GT2 family glycosyltransferase